MGRFSYRSRIWWSVWLVGTVSLDRASAKIHRETDAVRSLLGEIGSDDAELVHDMIEGQTGLFEALEYALDEIRHCGAMEAGIAASIEQLNKRKSRFKRRQERLRGVIEQAMVISEIESHTFPCETVTVAKVKPAPIIEDESLIPSEFWKSQPPKLDKVALNSAAKDRTITGVTMSNGTTSLRIRRT